MAGSYSHVVDNDGTFRGISLLDNLADIHEAIEEMVLMIEIASDGDKDVIEVWRKKAIKQQAERY